jgi:hypothetical protein
MALADMEEVIAPESDPMPPTGPAVDPEPPSASQEVEPRPERLVRTVPQRRGVFGRMFRGR